MIISFAKCVLPLLLLAALVIAQDLTARPEAVEPLVVLLDRYPQRIPYRLATQLSATNTPLLIEMLREPDHARHHAQVVVLLGVVGDSQAVRPLVDVLLHGYKGKVNDSDLSVLIGAVNALGDLAGAGSNEALQFLLQHRLPADWAREDLAWTYSTMSQELLNGLLSMQTLMALGRSGRPEALAVLLEMSRLEDGQEELRQAAADGLHLHDSIQKKGRAAVLDRRFDRDDVLQTANYVYDNDARQFVLKRMPQVLLEFLAWQGTPVVVWDDEKGERQDQLLKRLAQEAGGLETLRQILLDIEAGEDVKQGTAVVTIADDGDAVVAIPLENSQSIVKKHAVSGVTVDPTGRLVIYMIRHEGRWYWNPFGW